MALSDDEGAGGVMSFADFIRQVNPTLLAYEHVPRLVAVLQKVADTFDPTGGESFDGPWEWDGPGAPRGASPNYKRVMILEPTRYFKSEVVSRLFPAYLAQRFPRLWSGITSYGAELAWELNAKAREYYGQAAGAPEGSSNSVKRWETGKGGGVWADGVGGALLGRGYHFGAIDDPVKPQEAASPIFQHRFEAWYPSTFVSRAEPGAARALIMQRLGPRDPVDFLFRREIGDQTEAAPEHWHVVCLDEIHSNEDLWRGTGPKGLPETCTLEDDWREIGDVLAPSRFSVDQVLARQKAAGTMVAKAQSQQRPAALTGDFWQRGWFVNVYDELPRDAYNRGKDWDTAFTKNDRNSASAYIDTARGPGAPDRFPIYVEDVDWAWVETPELVYWMGGAKPEGIAPGIVPVPGPHYVEDKASGKSAVPFLRLAKVPAAEVQVEGGDKLARAASVQPVVSSGRIWVNRRVLLRLLEGQHPDPRRSGRQGLLSVTAEMLASESGDLDVNDVFVQMIKRHTRAQVERRTPARVDRPYAYR